MNLVFDYGNVLIEWNKDVILNKLFLNAQDLKMIDDLVFNSGLWQALDEGQLSIDEGYVKILNSLNNNFKDEVKQLMYYWYSYVQFYDEVIKCIGQLKAKGHKIYVLSNTTTLFYDAMTKYVSDYTQLFDGWILSCEVKTVKPQAEIYQLLINKYQLDVSETYFFDDLKDNLKTAQTLGLNTYQVTDINQFIHYLKNNF